MERIELVTTVEEQRMHALVATMIADQIATAVEGISEFTGKSSMVVFTQLVPTVILQIIAENIKGEGLLATTEALCEITVNSMRRKVERDGPEQETIKR